MQEQPNHEAKQSGLQQELPLLLNADDVAQRLGVSRKTVLREDLRGHLPQPLRLGRCLRWSAEELSAWVRYGCPPHTPANAARLIALSQVQAGTLFDYE